MGKRIIPSMKPKTTPEVQAPKPEAPKPETAAPATTGGYEGFSPFEKEALTHYDRTGSFPPDLHKQPKQNPSPAYLAAVKPHAEKLRSSFAASKAKELGSQTPFALVAAKVHHEIGDTRKKYHEEAEKIANQITDRKERRKALNDLWHKHMGEHKDTLNNLSQDYTQASNVSRGNQALTHAAIAEPTDRSGAGSAMAGGGVTGDLSEKKTRALGGSPIAKEKSKQKLESFRAGAGGKDILEEAKASKRAFEEKAEGLPSAEDIKLDPEAKKLVGLYYGHYGDVHGNAEKWRSGKQHATSGASGLPGLEAMGQALSRYNPPAEGEDSEGHFERYLSSALRNKFRQGASKGVSPLVRKLEGATRKEEQRQKSGEVKNIDPATGEEKVELPSSIEDAHAEIKRLREQLGQAAPAAKPKTILRRAKDRVEAPAEEAAPEWDINEGPPEEAETKDEGDEDNIEDVSSETEAPVPGEEASQETQEGAAEEAEADTAPEGTTMDDEGEPVSGGEGDTGSDFENFLPPNLAPDERIDFLERLAQKLVEHKKKTGKFPDEFQSAIDSDEIPEDFHRMLSRASLKSKGMKAKGKFEEE